MRVLLDAHVSSRHVGRPLARAGHNVLALDQDTRLATLLDAQVLALAAEEKRIVLTSSDADESSLYSAARSAVTPPLRA